MEVVLTRLISRIDGVVRLLIADVVTEHLPWKRPEGISDWRLVGDMSIRTHEAERAVALSAYVKGHLEFPDARYWCVLFLEREQFGENPDNSKDIWNVTKAYWRVEDDGLNSIFVHGATDFYPQPWDNRVFRTEILTPETEWDKDWNRIPSAQSATT